MQPGRGAAGVQGIVGPLANPAVNAKTVRRWTGWAPRRRTHGPVCGGSGRRRPTSLMHPSRAVGSQGIVVLNVAVNAIAFVAFVAERNLLERHVRRHGDITPDITPIVRSLLRLRWSPTYLTGQRIRSIPLIFQRFFCICSLPISSDSAA
jgi:hypothetical protein